MCEITATYFNSSVYTCQTPSGVGRRRVEQASNGNGADEDSDLQQHAEDQEHEVQYEHGEAQHAAHLPATDGNGDDDKEEHEEEQHNGAEEAVGADGYRLSFVQQDEQEPWNRQTTSRDKWVL